MKTTIVVENDRAAELLGAMLGSLAGVTPESICVARGRPDAIPLARAHLRRRDEVTVLVVDAHTTNELRLGEQRSNLHVLLGWAAEPERWCLALMEPELEVVLVRDDAVVERLFGRPLDEVERALRDVAPRRAVDRLLESTGSSWDAMLERIRGDAELATMLTADPDLRRIVEFIESVEERAA